jgi:hypothetical protein
MKSFIAAAGIVLLASSTALAYCGCGYAAPVAVAPVPTVAYYGPVTDYYAPAPVVTYYAGPPAYVYPQVTYYRAPVVVPAPYYYGPVVVAPRVFVPGQPVRNTLRAVFP